MPKVLVTDASERAALAIIRSLGKKGVEVTAAEDMSVNAGSLSKYCRHGIIYPSPQRDYKKFLQWLLWLVKKESYDLLIPATEVTCVLLSRYREQFEPYVEVTVPSYDIMKTTVDKAQTIRIADEHSIPHPKTVFVKTVEDIKAIADEVDYPVVIKPRSKIIWTDKSAIIMKVTHENYAFAPKDLITKYYKILSQHKELIAQDYLPFIQDYVPGNGYGVGTLFWDSKPKAIFVHKRLREYPITGGASTLRVSVENEKLVSLALKILQSIHWQGVAMAEFKIDKRDGQPKLMEINGRFWGSLPLAIASGIDFPYLLYKVTMGREVSPQFNYRVGVKRRWLVPGDLLWLLSSLVGNSKKLHVIGAFLKSFETADDILSADDPLPFLGAIGTTMRYFTEVMTGYRNIYGEMSQIR